VILGFERVLKAMTEDIKAQNVIIATGRRTTQHCNWRCTLRNEGYVVHETKGTGGRGETQPFDAYGFHSSSL
jgi:hypothetical protein